MISSPASAQTELAKPESTKLSFEHYKVHLKQQAAQTGASQAELDNLFEQIKPFRKAKAPTMSEANSDSESIEFSLDTYLPETVTELNVLTARAFYKEQHKQLEQLGHHYGVQPRFILSLWAMQSQFGQPYAQYPSLSVLASLAFAASGDEERYFKQQFFAALQLLLNEQVSYQQLTSSSEGGLGPLQLQASDFSRFVQDGDNDGKLDIWQSQADLFATIGQFLRAANWNDQQTWGRQVLLPEDFDPSLASLSIRKPFPEWTKLGVTRFDGSVLPIRKDMEVSLIMPDGIKGRKYLVYDNYRALLKWNNSDYFALAVAYLSERIKYPPIN